MPAPKPDELRHRAVDRVIAGASVRAVAREFGIGKSTVADWVKAKMAELESTADGEAASLMAADPLTAAGLLVKAEDTGRVLLLQRSFDNPDDTAAGTWELPGGRLEPGDDPYGCAVREWQEELGVKLPDGEVVGDWISPDGVYRGYLYRIPSEDAVDLRQRDFGADPDGDAFEAAAWWEPADVPGMQALRPEVQTSDWDLILRAAERTLTVPAEANLIDHQSAYADAVTDDDGCGCGCGKCSSTCNGKCCADCEMKADMPKGMGESSGHPFRGNQYATGEGGGMTGSQESGAVNTTGDRSLYPEHWKGTLPPEPKAGSVRLYRGEGSGTIDAQGKGGRWFTTSWGAARYYAGHDNLVRAVDVPRRLALESANSPIPASMRGETEAARWLDPAREMEFRLPAGAADKAVWVDPQAKMAERYDTRKLPADHHHEDDPGAQPVIVWDLHGTLTPSDGFPVQPPFAWVKPLLDELAGAGICHHLATAALDPRHAPEMLDARRKLCWAFITQHGLPITFVTGKVGAHVYLDDRMVAAADHDGPRIAEDVYAILDKRAQLGEDGLWRLRDMEPAGEPIEDWPDIEDLPEDQPRGFSTPILDVDVHRCLMEANSSKNDSGLKPGALLVVRTLWDQNFQIHPSCAGFDYSAKPADVADQRLAGLRRSLRREGVPYDLMVTKNHATVFVDDKGMHFEDWLLQFPEIMKRMVSPEGDDEVTEMAGPAPSTQEKDFAEKTDQSQDTQPRKRAQPFTTEDQRHAAPASDLERSGPALQSNDQSTPTDPDQLQSESRRMVQERGSQDEMAGTGLETGVLSVSAPSHMGRLYADHPELVHDSAGDLQPHEHPILNRLYMEAMHRYANLVNNGVARHHALAAVKQIDPDFYIEEAQHTWLLEQLAARSKTQKGTPEDKRAGTHTDKKAEGIPTLYKMGETVLVAPGGLFEEGLALAISAFNMSERRHPELLLMGWSPPQPKPPAHVSNVYDAYEWSADDTSALADYLGDLYRTQYVETLNDHLAQSGVTTVSSVTDPAVLGQLDARAQAVAAGVGNSYNRELANQTYLTWIDQRSTLGRQSSEYTLSQEIDDWAAARASWKADQIALTESGVIANMAGSDFISNNPDAASTGHVEPTDAVCEECKSYVDQGTMSAEELASLDLPAHPNCQHSAVYDLDSNWAANRDDVWAAQAPDDQEQPKEIVASEVTNRIDAEPPEPLKEEKSKLARHLEAAHGVDAKARKLPHLRNLHQRLHTADETLGTTPDHNHGLDFNAKFGEGPGHPYRGNQYGPGESGGGDATEGEPRDTGWATADKESGGRSAFVQAQIARADQRRFEAQNRRDQLNRGFPSKGALASHLVFDHGLNVKPNEPDYQLVHARLHADGSANHSHAMAAGEAGGHPFRGNQYATGESGGADPNAQVNYPAFTGNPEDPMYRDAGGWGLKIGASERMAQMKELAASKDGFLGGVPPAEFLMAGATRDGPMREDARIGQAVASFKVGWLDSSSSPMSAMAQQIVAEKNAGMVWSRGLPVMEPSPEMHSLVDEVQAATQRSIADLPDQITVYRGVHSDVASRNALESWSVDKNLAARFDGNGILQATVSKDAVFMDLRGESEMEKELVLIGGKVGPVTNLGSIKSTLGSVGFDPLATP